MKDTNKTFQKHGLSEVEHRVNTFKHKKDAPKENNVGWSLSRENTNIDEKTIMAEHFATHHFLVREEIVKRQSVSPEDGRKIMAPILLNHGTIPNTVLNEAVKFDWISASPEDGRETVASILLNHGTTPNTVLNEAAKWIRDNKGKGPFFLTWYTPGHLIPATLKTIREQDRSLLTALKLFLFPGEVDEDIQSVIGEDAEIFAQNIKRHFTYAFLSAYAFDMSTGGVYFHFKRELPLQKACATRFADHKFLFLDSSKFKISGETAYGIIDMLQTAYTVTIYTVSSAKDDWIVNRFNSLCKILDDSPTSKEDDLSNLKGLRLMIVGRDHVPTTEKVKIGYLSNPQ